MPRVGLIILAAGSSSRLGSPKQLLALAEKTLLARTIEAGLRSNCEEIAVVLGSRFELIRESIAQDSVRIVRNECWQEGMAGSIRCGLSELQKCGEQFDAAIIAACDQPFLSSSHLDALIDVHSSGNAAIVASEYSETAGIPALFARSLFDELNSLAGASGAKQIILSGRHLVARVPFPEGDFDIDTQEDLSRLLKAERSFA